MTRRRTKSGIIPCVLLSKVRDSPFVHLALGGEEEDVTYPVKKVISFLKNGVDEGIHGIKK